MTGQWVAIVLLLWYSDFNIFDKCATYEADRERERSQSLSTI